jgi:hypothetical protein
MNQRTISHVIGLGILASGFGWAQLSSVKLANGQKISGDERGACGLRLAVSVCTRLLDLALSARDLVNAQDFADAGLGAINPRFEGDLAWLYGGKFAQGGSFDLANRFYERGCRETHFPSAKACLAEATIDDAQRDTEGARTAFYSACAIGRLGCEHVSKEAQSEPYPYDRDGQESAIQVYNELANTVSGGRRNSQPGRMESDADIQRTLEEQIRILREAAQPNQPSSGGIPNWRCFCPSWKLACPAC